MASSISAGTTSSTALVATADTSGALQLATNNGTVAVTVDASQNVGIGTTSPAAKLDVESTTQRTLFTGTAAGVLNIKSTTATGDYTSITFKGSGGYPASKIAYQQTASGGTLSFGTSNDYGAGITNTAMVIDSSGNVGIGTTSPSYRVDAVGAGAPANGIMRTSSNLTNSTTKYGYYTVGHYTNATVPFGFICGESNNTENNVHIGGGAGEVTAATRIDFYTAANNTTTSGTERMRIDSSGNVFVGGTTQNASTKPVYASTTAKAWVSFGGAGTINGSFNVSSVTRTSTGNFEVNFSSAMPNANYAATANSWQSVSNSNVSYNVFNFTTAKYQITTFENGSGTNPNATYSIVFAT